ncbi:MAG: VOC family protein [Acidimicrobiia bacterium]
METDSGTSASIGGRMGQGGRVGSWLGQYCINVTDLDRSVGFYEAIGLECTSRTEIDQALEAIVERPGFGSKLQLAQQKGQAGPIDMGAGFWKLYVNTTDIAGRYRAAIDAGAGSVMAPTRMDRWPVTIGFVADPDGYQVELVERHPWPDDVAVDVWLGQYCINVTDLDATVRFYETLGLECTSRTEIDHAWEAIVESPGKGSKLQLAQQKDQDGPIDMGTAFWKLYVNTDDADDAYRAAIDAGSTSVMEPMRLDRWPVTVGFVADPDGYQVELVQRHEV